MIHILIVHKINKVGVEVDVHVNLQKVLVRVTFCPFGVYSDANIYLILFLIDYDGYSCKRKWDVFMEGK